MNVILLIFALLCPASSHHVIATGKATYYDRNVMNEVYENRLRWNHVKPCDECVGMVAMGPHEHLGAHVYARIDGRIIGPLLVIDVGGDDWGGQVLELSFEQWHELGLPERPIAVTVYADSAGAKNWYGRRCRVD